MPALIDRFSIRVLDTIAMMTRLTMMPLSRFPMGFTSSVLINNYNNARYLRQCVDSVLTQSQPPDEVVVYDDGSTDESLALLRAYGNRIKLVEGVHDAKRPSRASQANAVYQGFLGSKGDYLFLLDGDDVFHPTKVERVMAALDGKTGVSLVQSPCTLIDENDRVIGHYRDDRFHPVNIQQAIYEQNDVDFFYPTSSMVTSRAALARVLPLDMSFSPELACDTRIAMAMPLLGRVITLEEPLVLWRRHSNSHFSSVEKARWYQAKQTYRRVSVFNVLASGLSARKLRLWRNRRFWRQVLGALLPMALRNRLRQNTAIVMKRPPTP